MIDALIAGRIFGKPAERESKAGKAYATAKVRVAVHAGESVFVNVIAFAASAVTALLALEDGAGVALAGELTPGVWTDKDGKARSSLDLVAHQVLTEYHIARRRKLIWGDGPEAESPATPPAAPATAPRAAATELPVSDGPDIPF